MTAGSYGRIILFLYSCCKNCLTGSHPVRQFSSFMN